MPQRNFPSRPNLWTVRLETIPALAESVAEILGDASLALTVIAPPRKPTAHIEAIYGQKPDKPALTLALAVMFALHKTKMPKLDIQPVPDLDWLSKVAADFPPLPAGRWIIHGGQHRVDVPDRRRILWIDATNAFGTGEHPTTRGCLMMLDQVLKKIPRQRRMLDMGCGSGILAMAWAKARPGRAFGVDNDFPSVRIARENARLNGLQARIHVTQGQGYSGRPVRLHAPYDLIMANIFARPLSVMAKDLKRHLRPGGKVILSGLLTHQTNMVLAAHRMQKIYPVKCFRLGEWAVLVLEKKSSGTKSHTRT